LIAGSFHAIHAKHEIATPADATIKIAACHGLKTDIVDLTFSMFSLVTGTDIAVRIISTLLAIGVG